MRFAKFYEIWNLKLLNFIKFYLRSSRLLKRRKVMRAAGATYFAIAGRFGAIRTLRIETRGGHWCAFDGHSSRGKHSV
ncbi:hypothetical protein CAMGR0001_1431 [Campylobacter gracilis RM3268]|uniref:Uncharacterized protein n=1 Tax=Campylobacter gracilis RM3268 TaxID=553220 RepID=C8PJN0_9BACT|nr:hypothetical protein CAMGR0001_1431 [Campylobacter gracilis RM3268]